MQIRSLPAVLFIVFLLSNCTDQRSKITLQAEKDSTANQTFFPVTDYIRGQLNEIDSLPITPLKITSYNGKTDSLWMKKEDIRPFAQPFLYPEIDTSNFKNLFSEKSFLDQTINAFTFSYDPTDQLPDTLELKRWDVYIDPQKNAIKRIYIVKEHNQKGITKILQLSWKSDQWCKITTITEQAGKPTDIKEELMKWDFSE